MQYMQLRSPCESMKALLLTGLTSFKDQMWQKVAGEMSILWLSAESRHLQLGEQD